MYNKLLYSIQNLKRENVLNHHKNVTKMSFFVQNIISLF